MERSIIFDLIDTKLLREWREEARESNECGFKQTQNELEDKLSARLDEEHKELLDSYIRAVKNRMDFVYYNVNIKMLNFGVKIGMELQRSFNNFEND